MLGIGDSRGVPPFGLRGCRRRPRCSLMDKIWKERGWPSMPARVWHSRMAPGVRHEGGRRKRCLMASTRAEAGGGPWRPAHACGSPRRTGRTFHASLAVSPSIPPDLTVKGHGILTPTPPAHSDAVWLPQRIDQICRISARVVFSQISQYPFCVLMLPAPLPLPLGFTRFLKLQSFSAQVPFRSSC